MLTLRLEHNFDQTQSILKSWLGFLSSPPLKSAGEFFESVFLKRINSSIFTPISSATKQLRRLRGRSSTKPLIETGLMLRSLSSQVDGKTLRMGVGRKHADTIRFGGVSGGFLPGKRIPPREFLAIDESMLRSVNQVFFDSLVKIRK
jgi:phage gpG-like protein